MMPVGPLAAQLGGGIKRRIDLSPQLALSRAQRLGQLAEAHLARVGHDQEIDVAAAMLCAVGKGAKKNCHADSFL